MSYGHNCVLAHNLEITLIWAWGKLSQLIVSPDTNFITPQSYSPPWHVDMPVKCALHAMVGEIRWPVRVK